MHEVWERTFWVHHLLELLSLVHRSHRLVRQLNIDAYVRGSFVMLNLMFRRRHRSFDIDWHCLLALLLCCSNWSLLRLFLSCKSIGLNFYASVKVKSSSHLSKLLELTQASWQNQRFALSKLALDLLNEALCAAIAARCLSLLTSIYEYKPLLLIQL